MKHVYIFCVITCSFWLTVSAVEPAKSDCLEKEKARTLLETAENLLSKASAAYPSCKEESISANQSDCGKEKSLAYIEISKKLISDVRANFPSCLKSVVDDNKNETKEEDDDGDDDNNGNDDGVQDQKHRDCSEILASGHNNSGIYTIWLQESALSGKPVQVYCDMKTGDGGWTVIQRRGKYPVQIDFNNDWETYKNGFGNLKQEFWLGNENIRVLCIKGCKIRFDLYDERGAYFYAVYEIFKLSSNYRIGISGYSGNATDSMKYHDNYEFSTRDKDVSGKVKQYQSGWWHGKEYYTNLNGIFEPGRSGERYVYWWKQAYDYKNLLSVEMKVKPN